MKLKTLIALSIAAVFPLGVLAQDKAQEKAMPAEKVSGAEAMFRALDKDKDGSITREEAKGTPHDADFAKLDKNGDGKLSREEHAAAPEHAGDKAAESTGEKASAGKTKQ